MPKPSVASLQAQLEEVRRELTEARRTQRASIQARERQVEDLDYTPMAIPVDFERPPTIQEMIATQIEGHLSRQASEDGYETFEESNDFEPEEEEVLPLSGFEVHEMELDDPPEGSQSHQETSSAEDSPQEAVASEAPPGAVQEPQATLQTEPAPGPENSQ